MPLLTQDEAKTLLSKVLHFSKADECQVAVGSGDGGNIRYARNSVSTSGANSSTQVQIVSTFGKKQGITTINEYDDASLEKAVRRAEAIAQLAPENPEHMPLLGPQTYAAASKTFSPETAAISTQLRANLVEQSLAIARDARVTAAGYLENSASCSALMNSRGLFAYGTGTNVDFSVTMRTDDGTGSGYASAGYNNIADLDVAAASKAAAWKAARSGGAKALEPGKYTVILEPAAGIVLLENLYGGLDARGADEGRNFLSLPGGKTRLGEKLVDEQVNIYSDPWNEQLPTGNYNREGLPQEKVSWIEKGVVKNLVYSRYWAQKKGVKPVPNPDGFIMTGGNASLEELIKGTERGVLVTRLWYIRSVDPQTLLLTGLTRDGTFYVENGEIKYPVKNFRFNESPIIMLNNLDAMGKAVRTVSGESGASALIPPMRVKDFTFTSLSDAI
ncbi:TldD/PmbA family protein [Puia sp.]|jgi:predicted Zn-dependent protease|uniref:TldD/PmbA family protein n=1 Tax=Puia sp. TaxID=2045100 RepID=UPI002F42AA25